MRLNELFLDSREKDFLYNKFKEVIAARNISILDILSLKSSINENNEQSRLDYNRSTAASSNEAKRMQCIIHDLKTKLDQAQKTSQQSIQNLAHMQAQVDFLEKSKKSVIF